MSPRAWDHILRPETILLPAEAERGDELQALFEDVLNRLSSQPGALEACIARQVVVDLWAVQRECDDAAALIAQVIGTSSYAEGRRAAFRETDERQRLRNLRAAGIRATLQTYAMLTDGAEGGKVFDFARKRA